MKNLAGIPIRLQGLLVTAGVLLLPSLAWAHPGHGPANGFGHGLAHPLTGLDHICAMVAVGLWAAQCSGRALWLMPLSFVSVMVAGGALGMSGISVPFVETGIVASVLILGIFLTFAVRLSLLTAMLALGAFAFFHGFAHGAEMPPNASGFAYGFGFVLATISLHACGIGLGLLAKKTGAIDVIRYCGGAIAGFGIYLCFA
jgi:urease accessory protein